MTTLVLRGITWNHSRGSVPMVATAQRYSERHPDVRIEWHFRSPQSLADQSITALSASYDLLVVDPTRIGEVAAHEAFVPLDSALPAVVLLEQSRNSVGSSYASYHYGGRQWALAIDAAAPVAAWRPDILEAKGLTPPGTWEEMLEWARGGLVAFAGSPLDCLMHWYSLCINEGQPPFTDPACPIVDPEVGMAALEAIKELTVICGKNCLSRPPVAAYELLTTSDRYAYSPLAYGYSNYAREGYSIFPLQFGPPPRRLGKPLCTTLGGSGLAISAHCNGPAREIALDYVQFVASWSIQMGLYTAAGGQPGHRGAWLDPENNRITKNFFSRTLPTLESAYVRPRHEQAIEFQIQAATVMDAYLRNRVSAGEALKTLGELDRQLRPPA